MRTRAKARPAAWSASIRGERFIKKAVRLDAGQAVGDGLFWLFWNE